MAKHYVADSRAELVKAVCEGSISAMLVEAQLVYSTLADRPTPCRDQKLRLDMVRDSQQRLAVISAKSDGRMAEALRHELTRLVASGDMQRISRRWGVPFLPEAKLTAELIETEEANRKLWLAIGMMTLLLATAIAMAAGWRRAQSKAEAATRARSGFLADMSHEIRTPLSGVIGLSDTLLSSGLTEEQTRTAASIQLCGRNLLRILNDVLDLSKLEAGKVRLENIEFRLLEPLRTVEATLRPEARKKGVEFVVDVDPALPEMIVGDPLRLAQILFNLVNNAVKFTTDGTVRIEAHETGQGRWVDFRVVDTGIGMDPDARRQLFQPFMQAEASTTRRFGGTGLGLAIVKRLIDQMGGDIDVTSTPGSGSAFRFRIPLILAEKPAVDAPASDRLLRVLIVDDNSVNRAVARALVDKLGHSAEVAEGGIEALDALAKARFDAVLLDCQMPEMDGYQTAAEIRRREAGGQRVWIVAATANTQAEDHERSVKAGMDMFLAKPFRMADLRACLNACPAEKPMAKGQSA